MDTKISEGAYHANYNRLMDRYRKEVIDWEEEKTRLLYLYRQEMLTNAQLHRELEQARETIEVLLSFKIDSRKLSPHSAELDDEIGIIIDEVGN